MPTPQTFDHEWRQLLAISASRGYLDRWPREEAIVLDPNDNHRLDTLHVALAAMHARLQHLCANNTTNENLWLIAGLIHQQMITPDDYQREHLYRLLTVVRDRDLTQISIPDVVALIDLVWALRLPADPETARENILRDWLAQPLPESTELPALTLANTLTHACPPDWQHITGTLTLASGQVLTNLTVTTTDPVPATMNQLFSIPETISWRAADGHTWWRLHTDLTRGGVSTFRPVDESVPPPPEQLLRLSDFHAEHPPGPLPTDTPQWLRTYCDNGTIDYGQGRRLVIGTAEALDIVGREATTRGIGDRFDTTMLVAIRLPVGYRIFMHQPADTPFDQLILDSPRFYVGDDGHIYPTTAANPVHAADQFRSAFADRNGYDSTTPDTPWPSRTGPVIGPRKT